MSAQPEEVVSYKTYWDLDDHFGGVVLSTEGGDNVNLRLENPAEFAAVSDMLRNEKPVYYDSDRKFLHTSPEPVGFGE